MSTEFRLSIELGNEAMEYPEEIGRALATVSHHLKQTDEPTENVTGVIRDANGNTVGNYGVITKEEA